MMWRTYHRLKPVPPGFNQLPVQGGTDFSLCGLYHHGGEYAHR